MKTKLVFLAALSLLTIHSVFAQWVQTGGPYGSTRITSVFANNHRIYANTSCGLHSTGSLTDKWDLKSMLQMETYIKKGDIMYFGGKMTGIQRLDLSEPGFVAKNHGLNGVSVITLKDANTCMYAGIEGQGFCSSMGYSSEWTFYNTGLPAETRYYPPEQGGTAYHVYHVNSIEIIDNTIYCATHLGVYHADREALRWTKSGTGLPSENVQQLRLLDGVLFACQGRGLYFSLDKGENWNLIYQTASDISSFEKINNNLFLTTLGNGIYVSVDNGRTWSTRNEGLTDLKVTTLTLIENTPVCGTQSQGVFYFDGNSWVNHSAGIICSDIRSMGIMGNIIAANDSDNVYMANGKTNAWINSSPAVEKENFGYITTMGNRIFLSYISNDNTQVIKYSDGENVWQDLKSNVPFTSNDPYRMSVDGDRFYVYEDGRLYYTDDLGATWGNLTLSDELCTDIYDFVVYKNIPFAASCGFGELLRLSDNMQWGLSNDGLPVNKEVTSMAYSTDALYAYSYTNGIFVSRDAGKTWAKASKGFYNDWNIRSFAYLKDHIFVTTVKGIYYSTDFGQNWVQMNEGLKNTNAGPIVIFNDTLYVGTRGNGIWKHDLLDFLPAKEDTTPKIEYVKIFPNPATEFVRFDFKDVEKAQIRIIDILGREMINTKPDNSRQISVARLSSGTYIIVINTDRYVYTSKLIINRRE